MELVKLLVRGADIIQGNSQKAAVMVESYTGPAVVVFEKVLTIPASWSTYRNMVVSEKDVTSMAKIIVDMTLWSKVSINFTSKHFNMKFARQKKH